MFWKRCFDDVLSAVSVNEVARFLSGLNSVESSSNSLLNVKTNDVTFLDLNVHKRHRGNQETSVYRKPTHTDKYLAFDSHHPNCNKKSVTRTLLTRTECLPSSYDSKEKERQHALRVFKDNGYSKTFLLNCCKPVTPLRDTSVGEVSSTGFEVVPYIRAVTENMKRILASHNVKIAQKPFSDTGV